MKLQHKLSLSILLGLIIIIVIIQVVLFKIINNIAINGTKETIALIQQMGEQSIKNIFHSIERATSGSLERGEMEKFTQLISDQKKVEGLIEFSLYDHNGRITHSSDDALINKQLPRELRNQLLSVPKQVFRYTNEASEIYNPQVVNYDCIRCHRTWKYGNICGVISMRFSTENLSKVKMHLLETLQTSKKKFIINSIFALVGIVIVFMGLMYISVSHYIKNPLKKLIEAFRDLSEVDLTMRLIVKGSSKKLPIKRMDEIEELSINFNSFIMKLHEIIKQLARYSTLLIQSSGNLSRYSEKMFDNMEMLKTANIKASKANEQLSFHTNSLAASTEEMSVNINHISKSAGNIAKHMNSITLSSDNMNHSINSIGKNIYEGKKISAEGMNFSQEATQNMKILDSVAREIDQVSGLIKRISIQTNILALNASIEAASAGNAGRGFSVVAEKIKQFASQNSESAENIANKINDVQLKIQNAVKVINNITIIIEKINQSYSTIAHTIDEQIRTSENFTREINEINTSSNEIACAIAQAAEGVNEISKSSESSAIATNDFVSIMSSIKVASETSDQSAKDVQQSAYELDKISDSLNRIIDRFIV
jgi:methyl-accepting chemotaxis protein